MRFNRSLLWISLGFVSCVHVLGTLRAAQNLTLAISGHSEEIPVVQVNGRSYVELEALTRLLNGSIAFRGDQILLTLPSGSTRTHSRPSGASHPGSTGFSKEYVKASMEELSAIREWRSTLISAVRHGHPVTAEWVATFHNRAQYNLKMVEVAASTESDRNALELVTNEFNNMKKLSDRFVEANRSRTYMPTDALENDPLDRKIVECGQALAAMDASQHFVDDGSCH